MLLPLRAGGLCLLLFSLLDIAVADKHSQFDYRKHHEGAAALANGHDTSKESSSEHEGPPRLNERRHEPERWAQYIPYTSRSIAEEMSEARRHARQEESKRIQMERQEQEQKVKQEAQEAKQAKVEAKKSKSKNKAESVIKEAARKAKSATKKTTKKVQAKAEHWLELDDDDDDDEDDEDEDGSRRYRRSRRRKRDFPARVWGALKWVLAKCYLSMTWSGRNLLWIPSKYAVQGVRWSAQKSWKTTRWTSERALVGPALTVGAPVIYLGEGFLFLFVWTPARIANFLARELYPIYIFLGAALAVGTAMGIASAIILYVASFFLNDSSTMEEKIAQRGETFPDDLQKSFRQRRKSSAAKRRSKSGGESVIGQAIQESLDRVNQKQRGPAAESDESAEDDDYFGPDDSNASIKGKARSMSGDQSLTASARRTPTHFGQPLPIGATGWNHSRSDSSSSSPALSPTTSRNHIPSVTTPPVYPSAKGKISASPLTSPDVFRSRSSRQRRGVSTSV